MANRSFFAWSKKTWRLRREVRFDEVHFEQFHVDWQNSHLVHCMSVWWICWKQFHSNSLFLIFSLYLLDLKLHSSRKILVRDCACTVARRSCGSFVFNQNSLRSWRSCNMPCKPKETHICGQELAARGSPCQRTGLACSSPLPCCGHSSNGSNLWVFVSVWQGWMLLLMKFDEAFMCFLHFLFVFHLLRIQHIISIISFLFIIWIMLNTSSTSNMSFMYSLHSLHDNTSATCSSALSGHPSCSWSYPNSNTPLLPWHHLPQRPGDAENSVLPETAGQSLTLWSGWREKSQVPGEKNESFQVTIFRWETGTFRGSQETPLTYLKISTEPLWSIIPLQVATFWGVIMLCVDFGRCSKDLRPTGCPYMPIAPVNRAPWRLHT